MTDREKLHAEYKALLEPLERLRFDLESWLRGVAKELSILEPRIESRVKDPRSLILKTAKKEFKGEPWNDPLREASDKVGVRIDVVYCEEVSRVRERIEAATDYFEEPIRVDDKRENQLGVDRLGYNGVHCDVIPRNRPDSMDAELARCEIQVRTNAQASWAMATHDLTYKAPVEPPEGMLRRLNRLTALLELVDDTVQQARYEMMGQEGYSIAIVIKSLEAIRMVHSGAKYDKEMTRDVAEALVPEMDAEAAHDLAAQLQSFEELWSGKLDGLIATPDDPLLAQPESILVYFLLETDKFDLQRRWTAAHLPHKQLESFAIRWGTKLPSPH